MADAGVNIETGVWTPHVTDGSEGNVLHPYDAAGAASPGVQAPTEITPGQLSGPTYPARDTTGEFQSQMAAGEAAVAAAQARGQDAEVGRREHYSRDMLPMGADYGDLMSLPTVPEDSRGWELGSANAASQGFLYGPGGDQPGRDPA